MFAHSIWFIVILVAISIVLIHASITPKRSSYSPPVNLETLLAEADDASDAYIQTCIQSEQPNLPNSLEYVTNSRGQKLHVRTYWPSDGNAESIVFSLHGHAGHGNRPTNAYIARELNAHKIAYITLDFHGHGYSEGDRCRIVQYHDLIDDVMSLLAAIYIPTPYPSDSTNLRAPSTAQQLPFFICGLSMGGATALAVSNTIRHDARYHKFRGLILAAPMIQLADVSPVIKTTLALPLQRIVDKVPFDTSQYVNSDDIWRPHYIDYVDKDSYPKNPQGLTFHGVPWVTTLQSLMNFIEDMPVLLPQVDCPFIVLHDPEDNITKIDGSYALMEESSSKRKHMVSMPGAKHDLIANRTHRFIHRVIEWMRIMESS
uniref:Serine aminopeptidase S33 domain-containing protein n=1 Tax=viral metagenome TaxID=1070528 RepID=A0A6C0KKB6_9ZZZZ